VLATPDGHRLANALVLALNGAELFDDKALAAFEAAAVEGMGGAPTAPVEVAGRAVLRSAGADRVALGFREGNLLAIVSGPVDADVTLVVTRQLEALARGEVGTVEAFTPLVALEPNAAFVPVDAVTFEPIPPAGEEPSSPEVPDLAGATAVEGRYGVVAGERRTVVWAIAVDRGQYPSAEALAPALPGLASARAAGAPPQPVEVIDRVVLVSTNEDGSPSARVFRHQGLVLVVEGNRADQLDAVVTAWIVALGPG
jgi:hypothetical protein